MKTNGIVKTGNSASNQTSTYSVSAVISNVTHLGGKNCHGWVLYEVINECGGALW